MRAQRILLIKLSTGDPVVPLLEDASREGRKLGWAEWGYTGRLRRWGKWGEERFHGSIEMAEPGGHSGGTLA